MEVKIKESGKVETLSIIDPKTGCCYVADLIGNADGFSQFEREGEMWVCDQETFDWWDAYITLLEKTDDLIEGLEGILGCDFVHEMMDGALAGVEFSDIPAAIVKHVIDALEDGEALKSFGIGDDSQEAVENAHALACEVAEPVK